MTSEPELPDGPPTPEELPALAGDVVYERQMFMIAADRLADLATSGPLSGTPIGDQADINAWVEVGLLHARNLIDFFLNKPIKDEVVAGHYVKDWSPEDDGNESLAWLEEMREPIHKRLAHITAHRQRVDKGDDARLVRDVVEHMQRVADRFNERLPDDHQAWFLSQAEG